MGTLPFCWVGLCLCKGTSSGKEHIILLFLIGYGCLVQLFCRASICVRRQAPGPWHPGGTSCLSHLQPHHCLNLGYPFILSFFFLPLWQHAHDKMNFSKEKQQIPVRTPWAYRESSENQISLFPCFKSVLSFDTCWPKVIIYSVQPVVKRTQREILAKLFLHSFNWAWF